MPSRRRRFTLRSPLGYVTIAIMAASMITAIQVTMTYDPDRDVPEAEATDYGSVPVDTRPVPIDGGTWSTPADAVWPAAGIASFGLGAADAVAAVVGGLPVSLSVQGDTSAGDVAAELLPEEASSALGVSGPVLVLDGSADGEVAAALDYTGFRSFYGGDWDRRLKLVAFPACAATTPALAECRSPQPVVSANDVATGKLSGTVGLSADAPMVLAIAADASSEAGDYKASDLQASGSWSAGESSGGFSYANPLRLPPAEGPIPEVALNYSSQTVDGRMAGANNQASWAGDGWDYVPGFIERSYVPCIDDRKDVDGKVANNKDKETGDQCWSGDSDNITLSLNGTNGSLIKDDEDGTWRLQSDANFKIQKLGSPATKDDGTTEHWIVHTPDGTKYYFASDVADAASRWTVPVFGNHTGEDCHASEFKDSSCKQAWRWLLDKAVDVNGNTVVYDYATETGHYGAAGDKDNRVSYIRGGRLQRIDYGLHSAYPNTQATGRVVFDAADRCLVADCFTDGKPVTKNWPDVPWDSECQTAPCTEELAPVFFNTKRLTKITTQVSNGTTGYDDVESWTLSHEFKEPTVEATASLWLKQIQHSGLVGGTLTDPPVRFTGVELANRANATVGAPIFSRYRVQSIRTESGADILVTYSETDCDLGDIPAKVEENDRRCYPVYWSPAGTTDLKLDWFHKYVVDQITESDLTAGQPETDTYYEYSTDGGGVTALWAWDDGEFTKKKYRTYGQWRGYSQVTTKVGDPTKGTQLTTRKRFYRGMDQQPLPGGGERDVSVSDGENKSFADHPALAGMPLEEASMDGAEVASAKTTEYWTKETASRDHPGGTDRAYLTGPKVEKSRRLLAPEVWARTETVTGYNDEGRPITVSSLGDIGKVGDETCTTTTYVGNSGSGNPWLRGLPARVETVAKDCATPPTRPTDVLSDELTFYDGATDHLAAPTKGLVTRKDVLNQETVEGVTSTFYATTEKSTYDALGRVRTATDARGETTTTDYTPAGAGPVTMTVSTNPLGHKVTTYQNPAWAEPTAIVDANNKRTDLVHDELGRLVKVWLPGRPKATTTPNLEFSYLIRDTGPLVVTSKRLGPNGNYITEVGLFDSRYRSVQKQEDAPDGTRLVTTTGFDDRGQIVYESGPNHATGAPTGTLAAVTPGTDRARVVKTYDALGRIIKEATFSGTEEIYSGTTTFGGDPTGWQVLTTPPQGGTTVATITDVHDKTIETRQFNGAEIDTTRYTYNARGDMVSVVDSMNRVTTHEYDVRGNEIRVVDPDKGTTTVAYNNAGDVISSTDGLGRTVSTEYDDLGRQIKRFHDGTLVAETTYDTVAKGHLAKSTTFVDGQQFTRKILRYTDAYDIKDEQSIVPAIPGYEALAGTFTSLKTYKADGSPASLSYWPLGGLESENIAYTYDDLGHVTDIVGQSVPSGTIRNYVDSAVYTPWGELEQRTFGAGGAAQVQETLIYEEVTRRLAGFWIDRSGSVTNVADVTYEYDQVGNVLSMANRPTDNDQVVRPGASDVQCFRYDDLRRLEKAWAQGDGDCAQEPSNTVLGGPAPYWHSYTMDKSGSRKSFTDERLNVTSTYEYPAAASPQSHGVETVRTGENVDHYDWDAAGNLAYRRVGGVDENLTWTPHGKLDRITDAAGETKTRMVYDADGNRIARLDENGDGTLFVAGQELAFQKATSKLTATRYYEHNGDVIASRTRATGDAVDDTLWQISDHNGTASWQINGRTMVESVKYTDPYGTTRGTSGGAWGGGQRGFVGGTEDPTGLTLLGARFYDQKLGSFISVDPKTDVFDPQRMHPYAYANNNPVTFSDPDGLFWGAISKAVSSVGNAVATAATAVVNNAGTIAAVAGTIATVATFLPPPAQVVAAAAGAVAAVAGAIDTAKSCIGGDVAGCAMGVAGMVPGLRTVVDAYDTVTGAIDTVQACASGDALGCVTGALPGKKGPGSKPGKGKDPSAGGGCAPNSFLPGTEVLMADGSRRPIENIELDDQVLSTDPETGEIGARPVTALITGQGEKKLVEISVDEDGDGESDATVTATDGHPFWIDDEREWLDAGNLKVGAQLLTPDGARVTVVHIVAYDAVATVHNLTVADFHTYFIDIAERDVLVHNSSRYDCYDGDDGNQYYGLDPPRPSLYERPTGTPTKAQRDSVQGMPCVTCGSTKGRMRADHKEPLVMEWYTNFRINMTHAKSVSAVQPQCKVCSDGQGGRLKAVAMRFARLFGLLD